MNDVIYIISVMLGWPIIAALGTWAIAGGDAQVFLLLWFVLVIGGWLITMSRMPRR
jgi:hypothetical protein